MGVGEFMGLHTQSGNVQYLNTNNAGEKFILNHFLTKRNFERFHEYTTSTGDSRIATYQATALHVSSEPHFPIDYKGHSVFYPSVKVFEKDLQLEDKGFIQYSYAKPAIKQIIDLQGDFQFLQVLREKSTNTRSFLGPNYMKQKFTTRIEI